MADRIYLDQHTATRPHPAAAQELLSFYHEHWGAFSAPHPMAQDLSAPLTWASAEIRAQLGADGKDSLYFFSSDAAAHLEILLSHYLEEVRHSGKNHILAEKITPLEALGCVRKSLPYNEQGQITKEALAEALSPRVSLVSIPWACGLTGVIQPIRDLAEVCAAKGVFLHVDASAVIGKLFFRLDDLPINYLTIEGSLIHAPQGTALLYVKQKTPFTPSAVPSYQIAVGGLTAFARALSETASWFDHLSLETARLRARFEKGILEAIPSAQILHTDVDRLPHCSAVHFPGVHPEALLYFLQRKGVYAAQVGSGVSFTLSFETTEEEIDRAVSLSILSAKQLMRCSQEVIEQSHGSCIPPGCYSKKLGRKIEALRHSGSYSPEEASERHMRLATSEGKHHTFSLRLYLLIDPQDGIIADARFQAFGPSALLGAAEAACELILRKNYDQARRITAELIDKQVRDKPEESAFPESANCYLNLVIDLLEQAAASCEDIPVADAYVPTPFEPKYDGEGYPGWSELSREQKIAVMEQVIASEIRPYIELDAGGVQILDFKEDRELHIIYEGACTTCYSATGSTLNAIQGILRAKIDPRILVVPKIK